MFWASIYGCTKKMFRCLALYCERIGEGLILILVYNTSILDKWFKSCGQKSYFRIIQNARKMAKNSKQSYSVPIVYVNDSKTPMTRKFKKEWHLSLWIRKSITIYIYTFVYTINHALKSSVNHVFHVYESMFMAKCQIASSSSPKFVGQGLGDFWNKRSSLIEIFFECFIPFT